MKRTKKISFAILTGLLCLNIFAWTIVWELSQPNFLEVNFFDVGQGDAIFVQTPRGHQILIDGGPDSTILEKISSEMPPWDRTIDLVILTHPESDHLSGLIEVLKRYKVDFILWSGVIRETNEFKEWQKLIDSQKEKGARVFIAKTGQKIFAQDVVFNVINPLENLEGQTLKDVNNTSVVAKLVFGENSFLFTGDIYKSQEEKIIRTGADIDSDVLKISHHGSKSSSAEEFIQKVSPKIAVICVGNNNHYGHPHSETLDILKRYNITVLRTDKSGDIKIISDEKTLKVQ